MIYILVGLPIPHLNLLQPLLKCINKKKKAQKMSPSSADHHPSNPVNDKVLPSDLPPKAHSPSVVQTSPEKTYTPAQEATTEMNPSWLK